MTTKTIEMDCVLFTGNAEIDLEFWAYMERNNILPNVITWNGPGGGNPVVHFTGTDEALRNMLADVFESDEDDVDFYMSEGPYGGLIE